MLRSMVLLFAVWAASGPGCSGGPKRVDAPQDPVLSAPEPRDDNSPDTPGEDASGIGASESARDPDETDSQGLHDSEEAEDSDADEYPESEDDDDFDDDSTEFEGDGDDEYD